MIIIGITTIAVRLLTTRGIATIDTVMDTGGIAVMTADTIGTAIRIRVAATRHSPATKLTESTS